MAVHSENVYEKMRSAYRSGGLRTLFFRTIKLLMGLLFRFHTSYWYMKDTSKTFEELNPKRKVKIDHESIDKILDWERDQLHDGVFTLEDSREIKVAYENHHDYINILHAQKNIGFLKVGFNNVYFKEYTKNIKIPQNTAFIYDTFITEEYRGMGVAPYVINETMKSLPGKGIEIIACHIVPTNFASQRTYEKIGFKRVHFIWHLRVFGFRIFNLNPENMMKRLSMNDYC